MIGLPAGPELDALVAEKVMGLGPQEHRPVSCCNDECERCGTNTCRPATEHCIAPPFWTDIAAAWLVVERLQEQGLPLRLEEATIERPLWVAAFVRPGYETWSPSGGETETVAICRAALAAVARIPKDSLDTQERHA